MTIDPCVHSSDFRNSPDTPCHAMGREGGLWQTSPHPSCLQQWEAYAEPRRTSILGQQAAHPQMQYGLAPQWAASHDLKHRRSLTPPPSDAPHMYRPTSDSPSCDDIYAVKSLKMKGTRRTHSFDVDHSNRQPRQEREQSKPHRRSPSPPPKGDQCEA